MSNRIKNIFLTIGLISLLSSCSMPHIPSLFSGDEEKGEVSQEDLSDEQRSYKVHVEVVEKGRKSLKEIYLHPVQVTAEAVAEELKGLSIQRSEYPQGSRERKNWSVPSKLFNDISTPLLAQSIAAKFGQITQNEEVYFSVELPVPVEGKTFITPSGWYWFIRSVDGDLHKSIHPGAKVREWKVSLHENESYVATSSHYHIKEINRNWVLKPLPASVVEALKQQGKPEQEQIKVKKAYEEPLSAPIQKAETVKPLVRQLPESPEVIEKKIAILEKLRDKGVISEEEFQAKMKQILNRDF